MAIYTLWSDAYDYNPSLIGIYKGPEGINILDEIAEYKDLIGWDAYKNAYCLWCYSSSSKEDRKWDRAQKNMLNTLSNMGLVSKKDCFMDYTVPANCFVDWLIKKHDLRKVKNTRLDIVW